MKTLITTLCLVLFSSSSIAVDGNERFSTRIESTETRLFLGSMLRQMESYAGTYLPPVLSDFTSYSIEVLSVGFSDGAGQTLGRDATRYTQEKLSNLDFSIFSNPNLSISEFFILSDNISKEINSISNNIKLKADESVHADVDGVISEISQKFDDYRFAYLANKIKQDSDNKDQIITKLYAEYTEKIAVAGQITSLDKKIEQLQHVVASSIEEAKVRQAQIELEMAKRVKERDFQNSLQSLQNFGNGIAAIVGLANPNASQLISTTNTSILQIVSSLNALNSASGVAVLGQYGAIASSSVQLLQAWGVFGGKQKDGLASALKEISKQIERMQDRIDSRFDRLENQLYLNQKEILRNFALLDKSLSNIDIALAATHKRVMQIEAKLDQNQIDNDLKDALVFLENQLEAIDRKCLQVRLPLSTAKSCLNEYQEFVLTRSHSVSLTRIGSVKNWNEFIEWQINYYADSLGKSVKYSNISVIEKVAARASELSRLNKNLSLEQSNEMKSLSTLINERLDIVNSLVAVNDIDDMISSIEEQIEEIRSRIAIVVNKEFWKSSYAEYDKKLRTIKSELELAINERRVEASIYANSHNPLTRIYVTDLNLTISLLNRDINVIKSYLAQTEKRNWQQITSSNIDFPIIVHPKNPTNGQLRSFVIPLSKLKMLRPEISMAGLTTILNAKFEYDLTSKREMVKKAGIQNYSIKAHGNSQSTGHGSGSWYFDGFMANFTLEGRLTAINEDKVPVTGLFLQVKDSNGSCSGGLRRMAWFKNSFDPYSVIKLFTDNHYKHSVYAEACGPLLVEANGFIAPNLASREWEWFASKDYIKNVDSDTRTNFRSELAQNSIKHINADGTSELLLGLESSLNRLKGLIYFKNRRNLEKDLSSFNSYAAISSRHITDLVMTQLEFITLTGKGRLLSDIEASILKWDSSVVQ